MKYVQEMLSHHHLQGVYRELIVEPSGRDFSSNDYLGLSQNHSIRQKLMAALASGVALGATGSRLISGNSQIHESVEDFLVTAFRAESALLMTSGYTANIAVMTALGGEHAEFFSDEYNHASLIEGMRLCKAVRKVFRHNDVEDLRSQLLKSQAKQKVIVTESVFSMDGDVAPLKDLVNLAHDFDALLVVDEAHATGVFGSTGLGCVADLRVNKNNIIEIHTGGKALGGQGAFILASAVIRELIVNRAKSFIYSTGISPLLALQMQFAVEVIQQNPGVGAALLKASDEFRKHLLDLFSNNQNWAVNSVAQSASQIIPIVVGSNDKAMVLARTMQEHGINVRAIRSPTVRAGSERLRVTLKSFHTQHDFTKFTDVLIKALELWQINTL